MAYSCPVASTCGSIQRSTFYTRTNVSRATPQSKWGNRFGVSDPEWVTNSRTLVFGGSGSQVDFDDLGGGDHSFTNWLSPNADQGDGELSRDGGLGQGHRAHRPLARLGSGGSAEAAPRLSATAVPFGNALRGLRGA
ncbi:MAG TPA: hypothetical protein VH276_16680 [Solirubrobacteraceae bacterium]|nr:hypothetical protein [Solirubrobacteraceae bacterium]